MPPLVQRGEVYKHFNYTYPDKKNTADKLIIVLNKTHLPTQPIIAVPVATDTSGTFMPGYRPGVQEYNLPANTDFFTNNTRIHLYVLGLDSDISESEFIRCQKTGIITPTPLTTLKPATIAELLRSLGNMKEDVRQDYAKFLF